MKKERFEQLTANVQDKAKEILKVYDRAYIVYEYGEYHVSAGIGLKAQYADDHEVIGEVKADDIFTVEERIINYAETFHDFSPLYKGKRDYSIMKEAENDWTVKFKLENGTLVKA